MKQLDNGKLQALVDQEFDAHSLCGCDDVGHAVAGAAHAIIEAELEPGQIMNTVWNSTGVANQRHAASALWRALWSRKTRGLLRVEERKPMIEASISVLDVAKARDVRIEDNGAITGDAFMEVGLDVIFGCEVCNARLGPGGAYPTRFGYTRCKRDVRATGFATVEEFEAFERGEEGQS